MLVKRKALPTPAGAHLSLLSSSSRAHGIRKMQNAEDTVPTPPMHGFQGYHDISPRYPPTSTYSPGRRHDPDQPIFDQFGLAFFSPFCLAQVRRLFAEHGGHHLPPIRIATLLKCAAIASPPDDDGERNVLRDVRYYFAAGPLDPILAVFQHRPIVFFHADWVGTCVDAGRLVSLEPFIISRPRVKRERELDLEHGPKATPAHIIAVHPPTPGGSPIAKRSRLDNRNVACLGSGSGVLASLPVVHVDPHAFQSKSSLLRASLNRNDQASDRNDGTKRLKRSQTGDKVRNGSSKLSPAGPTTVRGEAPSLADTLREYNENLSRGPTMPKNAGVEVASSKSEGRKHQTNAQTSSLVHLNLDADGDDLDYASMQSRSSKAEFSSSKKQVPAPNPVVDNDHESFTYDDFPAEHEKEFQSEDAGSYTGRKPREPSPASVINLDTPSPGHTSDPDSETDDPTTVLDFEETYEMMMACQLDEYKILGLERA